MNQEKQFEMSLVKELKKRGVFAHHFDAVGCDGWPDVLALKNNECLLIECKYHTLDLRDEQYAFHALLKAKYGFNRIFSCSRMEQGYIVKDTCFPDYEHHYANIYELSDMINKELGDDRIPDEAGGKGKQ